MDVVEGHAAFDQGGACRALGACLEEICRARLAPGERIYGEEAQMFGGHCRCQCGQESQHLFSNQERRRWHRMHKSMMTVPAGGLI